MKSVLLLMAVKEICQYTQWVQRGHTFDDDDIHLWADATIANVYERIDIVRSCICILGITDLCGIYDLDRSVHILNQSHTSTYCIAIGSVHTSNIYFDANTKDIDTKFSRNLKSTSKETIQWYLK